MVSDLLNPSRGRQNAGPSQHACGVVRPPPKQHPLRYRQMSRGHYWEQCREWGERESEDEPALKKGEQPLYPLISL